MQPVELHQGHLTLIRAALRYWREENGTEVGELLRIYSGTPEEDLPTVEQVQWLMNHIDSMELRHATIAPHELHQSRQAVPQATTEHLASACSVLVLPTRLP